MEGMFENRTFPRWSAPLVGIAAGLWCGALARGLPLGESLLFGAALGLAGGVVVWFLDRRPSNRERGLVLIYVWMMRAIYLLGFIVVIAIHDRVGWWIVGLCLLTFAYIELRYHRSLIHRHDSNWPNQ